MHNMNFKILYHLWKVKQSASPSRQFKNELWKQLEQNWYTEPIFWCRQVWFKWSLVGAVSLLIVASFGTGVYAYNSPEVTEDNPLYIVKRTIEKVEETTKITPEAKARFLIKKIARREAEKQVMQKRGQAVEKIEKRIEKTAEQLQKTDEILQKLEARHEIKNKNLRPRVQELLEKRLEAKEEQLKKQRERIEQRQDKLEDKKEKIEIKINKKTIPTKKEKSRNGQ